MLGLGPRTTMVLTTCVCFLQTMAVIAVMDVIFMLVFLFECVCKIVSKGFYGAPTAYMSESWNRSLDLPGMHV